MGFHRSIASFRGGCPLGKLHRLRELMIDIGIVIETGKEVALRSVGIHRNRLSRMLSRLKIDLQAVYDEGTKRIRGGPQALVQSGLRLFGLREQY